ncbi:MAG: nucleotidyltransferase [Bacteroidetes bacterium]|nr:nucleotidyltransferase [Bacteroidota bacterium]
MSFDPEHPELLSLIAAFEKWQVQYLLVGGFAVNRYGYRRTTGDVDIFLKDTVDNRSNLINALDEMGYGRFEELMDAPIMAGYCEIVMDQGMYADLMTDIPGLEKEKFDEYFAMATVDEINGTKIRFLHYNHLLKNKIATGRTKDKLDVDELKRINGE